MKQEWVKRKEKQTNKQNSLMTQESLKRKEVGYFRFIVYIYFFFWRRGITRSLLNYDQ